MDHKKIQEEEIIDRYVLGKLSADDEELFEEHYFACDQCFEAIKDTQTVVFGLKDLARRGALALTEGKMKPSFDLFAWFKSVSLSPVFAVVSAMLALTLLYPAWRGIITVSRLKDQINELRQPQANTQSYYLEATRASDRPQILEVPVSGRDQSFILSFNVLEKTVAIPTYRAVIADQTGKVVWTHDDIKGIGDYEVFSIVCRSSFFTPGTYSLVVYEVDPKNRQVVNEYSYHFKVVFVEK